MARGRLGSRRRKPLRSSAGELVGDRRRTGQADGLADLAHARRVAAALDRVPDHLEDPALARGEAAGIRRSRPEVPVPRLRSAVPVPDQPRPPRPSRPGVGGGRRLGGQAGPGPPAARTATPAGTTATAPVAVPTLVHGRPFPRSNRVTTVAPK